MKSKVILVISYWVSCTLILYSTPFTKVGSGKYPFLLSVTVKHLDSVLSIKLIAFDQVSNLELQFDSVQISSGAAHFHGYITNPHLLRIEVIGKNLDKISDPFFVSSEVRNASVELNRDGDIIVSVPESREQVEFDGPYRKFMQAAEEKSDNWYNQIAELNRRFSPLPEKTRDSMLNELEKIKSEENKTVVTYIKQHPNSYVGFWMLVNYFYKRSYNLEYQKGFNALSPAIRMSSLGVKLRNAIRKASSLTIGAYLPFFEFKTQQGRTEQINYKRSRYTVVDFWFSTCGPCIGEFRVLKEIGI